MTTDICPHLANVEPNSADFSRFRPKLARLRRNLAQIGRTFGRIWLGVVKTWSLDMAGLIEFGRIGPDDFPI